MAYRVTVVDGYSFGRSHDLPLSAVQSMDWSRAWNTGHSGRLVFNASARSELSEEFVRTEIWPLETWLVVQWDNVPIYAGLITDHQYSSRTGQVTLSHSDIWWFWDRRHVLVSRGVSASEESYNWYNISYKDLAQNAVIFGTFGEGPLEYDMPIVLPPETGGTLDRDVFGYHFETVKEILEEATEGGDFDVDFRPRWSSHGSLEWVMEFSGSGDGSFLRYDLDADLHPVLGIDYKVVGSDFANVVYATGEGSEVDMKVAHSGKPDATLYPAVERVIDGKRVNTAARLQRLATAERTSHDAMQRQADITVHADGPPGLAEFRLGQKVHWRTSTDPYLPTVWHEQTLMQYSGSLDEEVVLTLSDWGG